MWKISNFDKLFQQALSGEVPAIHSIPFYSGIPGKLPIFLHLNCLMLLSHEFPPITFLNINFMQGAHCNVRVFQSPNI